MKVYKSITIVILMIFLTACTARSTLAPERTSPSPLEVTGQLSATPFPALTSSPTPSPTDTPLPTISPTNTPSPRLTYRCSDIATAFPQDSGIDGILAIWNMTTNGGDYLLDLNTGTKESIGEAYGISVSPDRKKLAYNVLDPDQLVVTDAQGNPLITLPVDPNWELNRWLDNDRLLIEKRRYVLYEEDFELHSLIVLNPFTGDQTEYFPEDFPNLWEAPDRAVVWGVLSRLVPDPTLTRFVYPANDEGDCAVILWDIRGSLEIARIHVPGEYGDTPRWYPDGSQFVVTAYPSYSSKYLQFENFPAEPYVGGSEIISMSADGNIQRLTYLTNTYVTYPSASAWSPDGRRIAFWLTIEDSQYPGERLSVVDVSTGQVTNYCIAGYTDRKYGQSSRPTWSPDGSFLAVTVPVLNDEGQWLDHWNVMIVDLINASAVQIAEDAYLMGWLISEP
jgi:hypothetical protein